MTAATVDLAGDDLIVGAEPAAAALVCAVNDADQDAVRTVLEQLDRRQLHALAVLLAALVPDDRPIRHRLEERDALRDAHAAYTRGVRTPEVIDGERIYQRIKARRHRAARYGRTTSP